MTTVSAAPLEFDLPDALAAHDPPEARGLARDGVRLMVSRIGADSITHTRFDHLPEFLRRGDLLVVNSSATINAAFEARRPGKAGERRKVRLHLSTPLSAAEWVVELRRVDEHGSAPLLDAVPGETIELAAGAHATLIAPYRCSTRLWRVRLSVTGSVLGYAERQGSPIRYGYVEREWPLRYYQTIFALEPGSVEMPSAGRAFTCDVVRRLARNGVHIAAVVLHAGVSSLEVDESPYPERYGVSSTTADAVNRARAGGGRVIAVGTTVVRALETVASSDGTVRAGSGWTDLVVTPERGLLAVDGLLTGLHAPQASHLLMLEAVAGRDHLAMAYAAALEHGYLWHELGDLHLLLP